jgi:ABC-type polar amino acid transport system ATPase subunit
MSSLEHHISAKSSEKEVLTAGYICKNFGNTCALKSLSFSVREKEILGIIGPSGSGKTTLLRCLDMLTPVDVGYIQYRGPQSLSITGNGRELLKHNTNGQAQPISEEAINIVRKEIGFVFQGFNLWEERTVLGNLILAPTVVRGESYKSAKERAYELCKQFGLEQKIHAKGWQLSGGQKQRIAIVRDLMMEPKLMLLDEITSALDPILTVDVMQAIMQLRDQGLTMIIVSHHIEFISSLCDRIMFLSQGQAVQIDSPENLRNRPATQEIKKFLEILGAAR